MAADKLGEVFHPNEFIGAKRCASGSARSAVIKMGVWRPSRSHMPRSHLKTAEKQASGKADSKTVFGDRPARKSTLSSRFAARLASDSLLFAAFFAGF